MDNNYFNNNNTDQENQNNQNGWNSQYTAGSQNGYAGNGMQQNPYQQYSNQPAYQTYTQPSGGKVKKPKKKSGFGITLAKAAAVAAVFGLVAGGIFTGISYAGTKALGITSESSKEAGKRDSGSASSSVQQTNTGSAKDLSDVSAIAKAAMPSIVAITNTGTVSYQTFWGTQERESESCGSGIIIRQDNDYLYIVTNNHVVADANTLTVQFSDNETVSCEVKGTDKADDLAVVRVALDSIKPETLNSIRVATIADSESLEVGQGVIAIGNALGYGQSVTNGIVSALGRTITVQDTQTGQTIINNNMIQTNAAINPGNSGGALINANGEVIGINSSKYSDTAVEGMGFAIPMATAKPILEDLIANGKTTTTGTPYLGIYGVDVTDEVSDSYNIPKGVSVAQVVKGSGADQAGIKAGNIITAVDGEEVSSMEELKSKISSHQVGDTVKLTVLTANNGSYDEAEIDVELSSQQTDEETSDGQDNNSGREEQPGGGQQEMPENGQEMFPWNW